MARPTKRWFQESDLLDDAIDDSSHLTGASLPSPSSGVVLRGLLPPLFTVKPDNVDFNTLKAGHYDPASYYAAQEGSDTVVLPLNQAKADAIGYDATRTFQAGLGNDTVTGGELNDLVYGGHGNDRLYGNNGNDALLGGEGHDWLIGAKGNDVLWAGNGIDYIDAGAGKDIIVANDDDGHLLDLFEKAPLPGGGEVFRGLTSMPAPATMASLQRTKISSSAEAAMTVSSLSIAPTPTDLGTPSAETATT